MKFSKGVIKYLTKFSSSHFELIELSSKEAALHNRKVIHLKDIKVVIK